MRVRVLSDLHLEFARWRPPVVDADLVILAGDLDLGREGLRWARQCFGAQPVVYVLGNHEFYRTAIPDLTNALREDTKGSSIHILENQTLEFNGWTIVGCTLWTDFRLAGNPEVAMASAAVQMVDYTMIDNSQRRRPLRPADTAAIHAESRDWLRAALSRSDPEQTIVVTHHAPSGRSIPPQHAGSVLDAAFASALDDLVYDSGVPLWIHGHTHFNVDYTLGQTRVLTNQRGYPDEACARFDPELVITL